MYRTKTIPFVLIFLAVLFGCESDNKPQNTLKTTLLLQEPIEPDLVETSSEALATWRKYAGARPTLLLVANNPLLQPVPIAKKNEAKALVEDGTRQDLIAQGSASRANPVMFPQMALSVALESRLFSKVVWILAATKDEQITLERFREKMLAMNDLSAEEAASFKIENSTLTGMVRGTPMVVAHYHGLPAIEGPVVVHLEMDFFPPLYTNEMKTPLYPLVYEVLISLRDQNYTVLDASIARGNLGGNLPLQIRFLGDLIARIMQNPGKLETSAPDENELRHSQALYLENFFQKEKIRDLYLAMEESAPADASVKYALFQMARRFRESNKALDYLQQAVTLDPVYALEYLALALSALEQDLPEQAIAMLELASKTFTDDPFIDLRRAEVLLNTNRSKQARLILDRLEKLTWSEVYHPEIPDIIKRMKHLLETRSS